MGGSQFLEHITLRRDSGGLTGSQRLTSGPLDRTPRLLEDSQLVVQLGPATDGTGCFPSPGIRGSESVFVAVFLDDTPQVPSLLEPFETELAISDDDRTMALQIMSCGVGAAGEHQWKEKSYDDMDVSTPIIRE